jgi:hypothetical protein
MIQGVHTMFYSSQPEELRSFLRDKLGFTYTDVGEGWLIFDMPDAEMGCHPADPAQGAPSGTAHISFYCDDIYETVAELTARGVEFPGGVNDAGYGFLTFFKAPGDFQIQLYQPKYIRKSVAKSAVAARPMKPVGKRKPKPKPRAKSKAKAKRR